MTPRLYLSSRINQTYRDTAAGKVENIPPREKKKPHTQMKNIGLLPWTLMGKVKVNAAITAESVI